MQNAFAVSTHFVEKKRYMFLCCRGWFSCCVAFRIQLLVMLPARRIRDSSSNISGNFHLAAPFRHFQDRMIEPFLGRQDNDLIAGEKLVTCHLSMLDVGFYFPYLFEESSPLFIKWFDITVSACGSTVHV